MTVAVKVAAVVGAYTNPLRLRLNAPPSTRAPISSGITVTL